MGSAGTVPPIITWDYQFAPNAQKARSLMNAAGINFRICEQPFVQPRPILRNIGITYRRVPVISIGKDVFIDNRIFMDSILKLFPNHGLVVTKHDHAYEAFGYRTFWTILAALPVVFLTPELIKERHDLFPVFGKKDYKELRPSAIAELKSECLMVENDFLANATEEEPFINGKVGLADIHAAWNIKFCLETLKYGAEEPGFSPQDLPKVTRWCKGLTEHVPEKQQELISEDVATKEILNAEYALPEIGIDEKDPTGLKKGDKVYVQTSDDNKPENDQQHGKLVGLGPREVVIELENGIRIHFPRIGYAVLPAK